jgi:hypothetical protein
MEQKAHLPMVGIAAANHKLSAVGPDFDPTIIAL